jgi:hypothetical protein
VDDKAEPQYQLFRRIKTYITMDKKTLTFYEYNDDSHLYKKKEECINPVSVMFDKEVHNEFIS